MTICFTVIKADDRFFLGRNYINAKKHPFQMKNKTTCRNTAHMSLKFARFNLMKSPGDPSLRAYFLTPTTKQ